MFIQRSDAKTPEIKGITIADFGIYSDNPYHVDKSSTQTTRIPARYGTVFGIMFAPQGDIENDDIAFTIKLSHPPLRDPNFHTPQQEHVVTNLFGIDKYTIALFKFHELWQLVPGVWTFEVFYEQKKIGEKTFFVYEEPEEKSALTQCAYVIQALNLTYIQYCTIKETFPYEEQQAYLTSVAYGGGYDCQSGCIYNYVYALTFDDGETILLKQEDFLKNEFFKHESFLNSLDAIQNVLRQKLTLSITTDQLKTITQRTLLKQGERYAIHYLFTSYLQGEITVFDDGQIQENVALAPDMLSLQEAKRISIQELKRLKYMSQNEVTTVTFVKMLHDSDYPGWQFRIKNYGIVIYIDGTFILSSSQGKFLSATKAYGPKEINLIMSYEFAKFEMAQLGIPKKEFSGGTIMTALPSNDNQCEETKFEYDYPTYTEKYDVELEINGNLKIYHAGTLIHETKISLDELEYYSIEEMIEQVFRDELDMWPDNIYENEHPFEKTDIHQFQCEVLQTRTEEHIVKICKNGMIQVFENGAMLKEDNIFDR